jgi:hypothetical protein
VRPSSTNTLMFTLRSRPCGSLERQSSLPTRARVHLLLGCRTNVGVHAVRAPVHLRRRRVYCICDGPTTMSVLPGTSRPSARGGWGHGRAEADRRAALHSSTAAELNPHPPLPPSQSPELQTLLPSYTIFVFSNARGVATSVSYQFHIFCLRVVLVC